MPSKRTVLASMVAGAVMGLCGVSVTDGGWNTAIVIVVLLGVYSFGLRIDAWRNQDR